VNEGRVVFECLHKVRLKCVFQKHRHGAMRVQIGRVKGLLVSRVYPITILRAGPSNP
jgi:hypothetical protein